MVTTAHPPHRLLFFRRCWRTAFKYKASSKRPAAFFHYSKSVDEAGGLEIMCPDVSSCRGRGWRLGNHVPWCILLLSYSSHLLPPVSIVGAQRAPQKLRKSHWCVPFTATFSKRRKIGALWSERCDSQFGAKHFCSNSDFLLAVLFGASHCTSNSDFSLAASLATHCVSVLVLLQPKKSFRLLRALG